jgi:hypothetical protein
MARKRTSIPTICVSFGRGKSVNTIVISPSFSERESKVDHTKWDRNSSVKKFLWCLSQCDIEGLDAATDTLIRLDCLDEALKRCLKGRRPNLGKLKTLLHLWNNRGLWSIPRALKEDLCLFTDAIRYFAPPYIGDGLTLYRGQSRNRHKKGVYGIAWTSKGDVAEQFSRLRDKPGIVVKVEASQDMIVVHVPDYVLTRKSDPASKWEYEDEYLLDPRKLPGMVTMER